MTIHTFDCTCCKKTITHESDLTTGYGRDNDNNKVCFKCCGENDKKRMKETGKAMLYFTNTTKQYENGQEYSDKRVCNWPNTLSFRVVDYRESWHNMARVRYDYWFVFEGFLWHGYTIGDNTQIAHCKKTKEVISCN